MAAVAPGFRDRARLGAAQTHGPVHLSAGRRSRKRDLSRHRQHALIHELAAERRVAQCDVRDASVGANQPTDRDRAVAARGVAERLTSPESGLLSPHGGCHVARAEPGQNRTAPCAGRVRRRSRRGGARRVLWIGGRWLGAFADGVAGADARFGGVRRSASARTPEGEQHRRDAYTRPLCVTSLHSFDDQTPPPPVRIGKPLHESSSFPLHVGLAVSCTPAERAPMCVRGAHERRDLIDTLCERPMSAARAAPARCGRSRGRSDLPRPSEPLFASDRNCAQRTPRSGGWPAQHRWPSE